jgi:recombinational DNA repair protein RecR
MPTWNPNKMRARAAKAMAEGKCRQCARNPICFARSRSRCESCLDESRAYTALRIVPKPLWQRALEARGQKFR